ncbi:8804_t:CDS:2 [Racocetra persica]|uniref:8804_t:CDS:1 n=1 Tax=Racocetra persica TaxID=160502 RepID=A0ACA9M5F0_9GLOM|nr:8804_t:CDS:2 [Racocetra persica]
MLTQIPFQTRWSLNEYYAAIGSSEDINLNSPQLGSSKSDDLNISLTRWSLFDTLDSFKCINLDLQDQYSDNYSLESNTLNKEFSSLSSEIHHEAYLYDKPDMNCSDSSSENKINNDNASSQRKYLFNIQVNNQFNTFEEIKSKLDRFAMERSSKISTIRCSLIDKDSVHNHPMDSNIKNNVPKYQRLTEEMINKVELYHWCNVQPIKIIHLLENEYPDHYIKP